MPNRRDFLRSAAVLAGGAVAWDALPEAIARAAAINPQQGTTFRDAEHVVLLMQENRSFDHMFGALRGVRGFKDPRVHMLPNGHPVWFQSDAAGATYAPFRLDIKETSATWIGGLPHSWPDQVDARNGGRYDKWLVAKRNAQLPLTLGYHARRDIPFYYALADAFTVCDAAHCSALTGTTPNRLFLWSGATRKDRDDPARVLNEEADHNAPVSWTTFPERLEDAGVSWRVYQNEISLDTGMSGEQDAWLSNFTDNPLEFFTQYNVAFSRRRRAQVERLVASLPSQIAEREAAAASAATPAEAQRISRTVTTLKSQLDRVRAEKDRYTETAWAALPAREKALHEKAFTTNEGDPSFRALTTLTYRDGGEERTLELPKGDVLHRFRQDVDDGRLPSISWIVAPENYSDHPSAAWYGAWYVSEVMNILTRNPAVWQKTIFILCYDENDGFFDHVPPFVAPHPERPETGKTSSGIDTTIEWANRRGRESSVGLGYRVPLVVASPWSRGGYVNSQLFDHTSVLRLLERWLAGRGKAVTEPNISAWRRTVCGDLTSVFRPSGGDRLDSPRPLERDASATAIHAARSKTRPVGGRALSADQLRAALVADAQEPGTKPSCALPYELVVNGVRSGSALQLHFAAKRDQFGERSQGSPFTVYSYLPDMTCRSYAVRAGDEISDSISISGAYHVRADGPNGFLREFRGDDRDPSVTITVVPARGNMLDVSMQNAGTTEELIEVEDVSYGAPTTSRTVGAGRTVTFRRDLAASHGWYDIIIRVRERKYRYAGRVETGQDSITDPAMR